MKMVIICGGIGSKMWPESRQKSPKHFLPLLDGKSLFEINWETLRKKFNPEDIFLQTNAVQAEIAKKLVPEIVADNILIEPEMRGQGPATGFAAAMLALRGYGDEPFMLIQTDLLRLPEENFFKMIEVCEKLALEEGKYITGGVKPKFAIMGIDYIIAGKKTVNSGVNVYKVDKFLWRDTKEKVEEYVLGGVAMAHWNHTCMTPNNFLGMMKKYHTDWYEPLKAIAEGGDPVLNYSRMEKGPLEEATQHVFNNDEALIVELPFECIDFGTWESVDKYLSDKGERAEENVINIDSKDNFVRVPKGKTVAAIGVEDLVVIDTGDALLISKKSQTGRVGEVVDKLKAEGRNEVL